MATQVLAERYELGDDPSLLFDRRDLLRVAGGGLIVACLLGEAEAQRPGGRRPPGTPGRRR